MASKRIHLICNAHLDPVWLWEREEGIAETLSTFRVAADMCEHYDAFVFNHNEVILYQWIEELDPRLFERIQHLVAEKRWHIMGGWYLQPDCNMPCGESFVRQMLAGRQYFSEKFNVRPSAAINFDPFGHSRGLVQLLAKGGFSSYIFCRPGQKDCPLPADCFVWEGHDGSTVMAARSSGYLTQRGKAREKIEGHMANLPEQGASFVLWGIGNHGGGPSYDDLDAITALIAEHRDGDVEIAHSTPEAFEADQAEIKRNLPRFNDSLNAWAPGCYTSQMRIKQRHRKLENQLYLVEKMCSHASATNNFQYPAADLRAAQEDLLYTQFHDILPGSSVPEVEQSALNVLGHGLETLKRCRSRAFFSLCQGQPAGQNNRIPLLVYNPHPFAVSRDVDCEFILPDQNWAGTFMSFTAYHESEALPTQIEREVSNVPVDWRKRAVFRATLAPMSMNRFDLIPHVLPSKPAPALASGNGLIHFDNGLYQLDISTRTGLIERYSVNGVRILNRDAGRPLLIADSEDPWGSPVQSFRRKRGQFSRLSAARAAEVSGLKNLAPVRVIEDGPVRSVVESLLGWHDSTMILRFVLPKHGTEFTLDVRVLWNEKDTYLKLKLPVEGGRELVGQVANGVDHLRSDGREAVAQKWIAVPCQRNHALTVINDGTYGCDFKNAELRLSLLRSPAYSALTLDDMNRDMGPGTLPKDRFSPRSDQGEHQFRFHLNAGPETERLHRVDREALVHNEIPPALSFFPDGQGDPPPPGLHLTDSVTQLQCWKRADDRNGWILRVFNPTDTPVETTLHAVTDAYFPLQLAPYELATFRLSTDGQSLTKEALLEQF